MAESHEKMTELLKMLAATRPEEVTCDECFEQLAEFADHKLLGKSVPESLRLIEEHLALCGECHEEYKILLKALRAAYENQ